MPTKKYQQLGLGGTFDHFHEGHKKFLKFSSELAERILIGVTNPKLTKHKPFPELIESYETRVKSVSTFCQENQIKYHVVELHDAYGPTVENPVVQALAVTPETVKGANNINQLRAQLNLYQLPVYICDYFLDSQGQPLHAENIRAGLVNRVGEVYGQLWGKEVILSSGQKNHFQIPQGELVSQPHASGFTAVVGDYCLNNFLQHHWTYNLAVYDLHEQRKAFAADAVLQLVEDAKVENPAGRISLQLVKALQTALTSQQQHLLIDGEEDLAAVALALLVPLNSHIYYGQPGQGMVEMVTTEDLKNTFFNWLK